MGEILHTRISGSPSFPKNKLLQFHVSFLSHMYRSYLNGSKITTLIIISLMTLAIPLPSLSASISLEYSIGFNDHFQLNTWTPVTVFIENKGRSTHGTLEVLVTSGSEYDQDVYQAIYATDAELPNNSKKTYALTVLITSANTSVPGRDTAQIPAGNLLRI